MIIAEIDIGTEDEKLLGEIIGELYGQVSIAEIMSDHRRDHE